MMLPSGCSWQNWREESDFEMSMVDYYEPEPSLACPVCGQALFEWQGTDGPCALFVWRQGYAAPVDQRVDSEIRLSDEELKRWCLPAEFWIGSSDCTCPFEVVAIGRTAHGFWTSTELITAQNARQLPHKRRSEFKAYLAWLTSRHSPQA